MAATGGRVTTGAATAWRFGSLTSAARKSPQRCFNSTKPSTGSLARCVSTLAPCSARKSLPRMKRSPPSTTWKLWVYGLPSTAKTMVTVPSISKRSPDGPITGPMRGALGLWLTTASGGSACMRLLPMTEGPAPESAMEERIQQHAEFRR